MKDKYLIKKIEKKQRRKIRVDKKRDELSIFVENLNEKTTEEDLKKFFGNVLSINFLEKRNDKTKHIGKVKQKIN